jgi:hypothetical protein
VAVIVALWHRWLSSGNARWIFLAGFLLAVDVFLASWITSLWVPALRDALR